MKFFISIFTVFAGVALTGCGNKVNFSGKEQSISFESPKDTPVVTPPVTPPVVVTPPDEVTPPVEPPVVNPPAAPVLKSGTCPVGNTQKVLSCLDCASVAPVQPPPLISRKAQELLDIMTAGCAVNNSSDPAGYKAPTHEELFKRVIQCSPTAYPDTNFESTQKSTVQNLLTNKAYQQNIFSGLYYNSASKDFETYFGLDMAEARYTFCRGQATFYTNGIFPKEYYEAQAEGRPYNLPGIYVRAQPIRANLRNCMATSLSNPNVNQPPATPGIACRYETAEGKMSQLMLDKISQWQAQGHSVYAEANNQCGVVDRPELLLEEQGTVKLAVKICEKMN